MCENFQHEIFVCKIKLLIIHLWWFQGISTIGSFDHFTNYIINFSRFLYCTLALQPLPPWQCPRLWSSTAVLQRRAKLKNSYPTIKLHMRTGCVSDFISDSGKHLAWQLSFGNYKRLLASKVHHGNLTRIPICCREIYELHFITNYQNRVRWTLFQNFQNAALLE